MTDSIPVRASRPRYPATVASVLVAIALIVGHGSPASAAKSAGVPSQRDPLVLLVPDTESTTTTRSHVHIAARTLPGYTATIGNSTVPVLSTGVFVRDGIPLDHGVNEIVLTVVDPAGQSRSRTLEVVREPPPPPRGPAPSRPLFIDEATISPASDQNLAHKDDLEVSFRGATGNRAEARVADGAWFSLSEEISSSTHEGTGLYRGTITVTRGDDVPASPIMVRLSASPPGGATTPDTPPSPVELAGRARVGIFSPGMVRLVKVKSPWAELAYGLHEVRLGGPFVARVPAGTLLRVTARKGDHFRVRLTPTLEAWVPCASVESAPPSAKVPHLVFTGLTIDGGAREDRVHVPFDPMVPFSIEPVPGPEGRSALVLDLFGAHHGTTWIIHKSSTRVIQEVSLQQTETDHLRIRIDLKTKPLWGYRWEAQGKGLVVTLRAPPAIPLLPPLPLKGLKIALEAGHGGPSNLGALGLAGTVEKQINLKTAEQLAKELSSAGATVTMVRKHDEPMLLEDRCQRVMRSDADLFVSVHANASESDRGFLSVGGVSTYYKNSNGRDLALSLQAALIKSTGLSDAGCVGNFNYYPLRMLTWMPSALIEQAFLSNPVEEAKLTDPKFRAAVARAARDGIEEFLRKVSVPTSGN